MGGMEMDADVERYVIGKPNILLDTAFATRFAHAGALRHADSKARRGQGIFRHGFPWSTVSAEYALLRQAGLS